MKSNMELIHYPIKIGRWFKAAIKKWVMLSNYVLCPENLITHSSVFQLRLIVQLLSITKPAHSCLLSHLCRTNTDRIVSCNPANKSDLFL